MSGIEAGLVLAIIPLLISAAEHYKDYISPIRQYHIIVPEVKLFQDALQVQQAIFKTQCQIVLEGTVERDTAVRMLAIGSADPSWQDVDLETQITKQLGSLKKPCVVVIDLIKQKLQEVENKTRELVVIADTGRKSKRDIARKIRACLTKKQLDGYITALRDLNGVFIRISNQMSFENVHQIHHHVGSSEFSDRIISNYRRIREVSAKVYEALGKACTKHTEHSALFGKDPIDQVNELEAQNSVPNIQFRIAFSRQHFKIPEGYQKLECDEPAWFMIRTLTEDYLVLKQSTSKQEVYVAKISQKFCLCH